MTTIPLGRTARLILAASFLLPMLLCSVSDTRADQHLPPIIEAKVLAVDLSDVPNPVLKVEIVKATKPIEIGQEVNLRVGYDKNEKGSIDWTAPSNRAKAFVLGLESRDMVRAVVGKLKDFKARNDLYAVAIDPLDPAIKTAFKGREKILDPDIIPQLRYKGGTVEIIVLLGDYQALAAKAADPKTREAAVKEIKELQDKFLKGLPKGAFEVTERFELMPTLAGPVGLEGLLILAADPLVSIIEANRELALDQTGDGSGRTEVKVQ